MIRFLQKDNAKQRMMLIILLSLVCVTMVITLIPGIFDSVSGNTGVYAKVGNEEITTTDIDRSTQQMAQRQNVPEQYVKIFRGQAASNLVGQAAMLEEARQIGLQVSDQELIDFLKNGPYGQIFFPNGQFVGQEKYEDTVLAQTGLGVADFEKELKKQLLLQKLFAVVTGSVVVPKDEVATAYKADHSKVKFQYAVLNLADVMKQVTTTEQELQSYYDSHKAELQNSIPEKRKADYVVVNASNVPGAPPVTDADLQKYYDAHRDQFRTPEEVNARHILVKPQPGPNGIADDKAWDAAKDKAEGILKQVKAGGDFAALAKKYSDDPGSAANGGSLGWFKHGTMVPPFDQAAFSLAKGQISDLVKSTFGYHIIRVEDKHADRVQSLAEVKAQIEPIVARENAQTLVQSMADKLETQARTEGLAKAAANSGLKVVSSNLFSRTDTLPGIGTAPDFMQAAFSAQPNSPAAKVQIPDGFAVVQVTDVEPAKTPSFEEAKARLEGELKNEKAHALLNKQTQELSDRAHALHDLAKAAKESGATVKTSDLVDKQAQVPDIGPMSAASAAFALDQGQISGPLQGANGTNGFVLMVTDRQEPSADDIEKNADQTRDGILQQKRSDAFRLFQAELTARMEKQGKIKYNEDERKQLLSGLNGLGS